ncbi:MAG: lipopolysaccharide assembly protein LapA domain-containing protein [Betaproteobacteria bacterium]|nr:lipopolysaccharide assembly protein LapA domain-containing protein [Betaproteobacteria bacterium]
MRFLIWGLRLLVLLFLFAFALKNTAEVSLNFFFGEVWTLPLSLLLLLALALGVVLGILAMLMPFFRAQREAARLRRELERFAAGSSLHPAPPSPDTAPDSTLSGFSIFPSRRKS